MGYLQLEGIVCLFVCLLEPATLQGRSRAVSVVPALKLLPQSSCLNLRQATLEYLTQMGSVPQAGLKLPTLSDRAVLASPSAR